VSSKIQQLIKHYELPAHYGNWVDEYFTPLAKNIALRQKKKANTAYVLGIQGTQGSGKSTAAEFIKCLLSEQYHLNCVVVSIDDFYLTLDQRIELSHTIHPLLKTRGVPGSHDIPLAMSIIEKLMSQQAGESTQIPRFDKASDDRHPVKFWSEYRGKIDVIIFEGWCVGVPAQPPKALKQSVNLLEANEDAQLVWRSYVNAQLANSYQGLFTLLDDLLVLQAPSFEVVYQWRLLQEQKLIMGLTVQGQNNSNNHTLDSEQLKRFISHYQRLTEHALRCIPERASWVLYQNARHEFTRLVSAYN